MPAKYAEKMARLTMNIPQDILDKADAKAKALGVTRTAYIVTCISRQLDMDEMAKMMPQLLEMMPSVLQAYNAGQTVQLDRQ